MPQNCCLTQRLIKTHKIIFTVLLFLPFWFIIPIDIDKTEIPKEEKQKVLSKEETEIQTLPETKWSTTTLAYLIKKEFPDAPVMLCISQAESQLRQYSNGEVLRGTLNPKDRGLFQINEYYHLSNSKSLGYDIYTIKGNIDYARYLYDRNGTRDWNWSREKWQKCQ